PNTDTHRRRALARPRPVTARCPRAHARSPRPLHRRQGKRRQLPAATSEPPSFLWSTDVPARRNVSSSDVAVNEPRYRSPSYTAALSSGLARAAANASLRVLEIGTRGSVAPGP